jgi:hypothetical protein
LEFLASKGYEAYRFELVSHRWAKELVVRPVPVPLQSTESDLLFVNKRSIELRDRIRSIAHPSADR